MFRKWLNENTIGEFDFSGIIFEKASNREYWVSKYKKEYIENAEQYLRFEWPIIKVTDYIAYYTEGDRIKQETPHFKRRNALIALLIGEIIEYKGRFIPDIIDGIQIICEEFFWGGSAHYDHRKLPCGEHYIDLFAAETGALIAIILYLLRDELFKFWPEIVESMEYNLTERIVKPYMKFNDFWWMNATNNWNPWILSNVLTVFLLTQQNKDIFHNGIEKMLYEINFFYNGYSDDGGCDEGITYWSLSGGSIFDFCDQLYRATNGKINFFDDYKINKIGDYAYKTYIGNNYFVNYADGSCKGLPLWKAIFKGYGERINNQNLIELSKENLGSQNSTLWSMRTTYIKRSLNNVIYGDCINEESNLNLCGDAVLPILQNAFARQDKWYYAAKGGHNNESHNHNDVGSFMAFYDCKPVLVDPGCGDYTKKTFSKDRYDIWTMSSDWHNTPTVNDKKQLAGRKYCANSFSYENKKCNISYSNAYEDGSNLTELTREILLTDEGLEITDGFAFCGNDNIISENFVTPLSVEIKDNTAIIDGRFVLFADCDTKISIDKQEFSGDEKLTLAWETDSMKRIVFKVMTDDKKEIKFKLRRLV